MSISPCDAIPILKRTGKFQPGPEINATLVQSQNTLTSNELLLELVFPGWSKSFRFFGLCFSMSQPQAKLLSMSLSFSG